MYIHVASLVNQPVFPYTRMDMRKNRLVHERLHVAGCLQDLLLGGGRETVTHVFIMFSTVNKNMPISYNNVHLCLVRNLGVT